ncbi:M50 family metallopeptidase [Hymenobacter sp. BT186]|uniref:M50 family metallopeptidase n=1 Tax=Hymenobacter telluris TaxID=2816474 RepID=A0A939J9L0_9BACT|nr:M50 family metallopeptidase [Hymenobacter telluris]MBO0358914.1 M50 family metallopeptidase [Hymenobacter telluris]MBW3374940.1 M50 family metallopeptidase [Hymenobacter norwichensis]
MGILLAFLGIAILFLLCRPVISLVHELGHATAGRLLSGQPVTVFVGSYGQVEDSLKLPLGRTSRLYVRWNLLKWSGGLCKFNDPLHGLAGFLMILAGPTMPVVVATVLVWWAFKYDANDLLRVWSLFLLILAVPSMLWNLVASSSLVLLADGSHTTNDGNQLRILWQRRRWPAAYTQALLDYYEGHYATAAPVLVHHLNLPFNQEDNIRMALSALIQTNEYEQAREILEKYGNRYQPTANDLVNQGVIKAHFNELTEAFSCYDQALALAPDNHFALNNRGYTYIRAKRYAESVADFRQALAIDSEFAYAHANLGLSLIMLDQATEGLECIHRSLALDDTNSYAYRNLGIYHLQRGELSEAQQQLDRAWQLDPHTDLLSDYRRQLQDLMEGASNCRAIVPSS